MIAQLVETLTVRVTDGTLQGDSLLEQLAEARYPLGDKSGGAGSGTGSPINDAAVELWARIGSRIRDDTFDWCGYAETGPTHNLRAWAISFYAAEALGNVTPGMTAAAEVRLQGYIDDIAALLNPPRLLPIRGHACPVCGESRVKVGRGILATEQPALVAIPAPLSISCRACGHYAGGGAGQRQNMHEVIAFAKSCGIPIDTVKIADAIGDAA